jgi:hypothetical protein
MLSLELDGDELSNSKKFTTAAFSLCEMRASVCIYEFVYFFIFIV